MSGKTKPEPLNVDRLDRLTAIVERTRRTMGVPAARELWPMLGLPDFQTAERRPDEPGDSSTFSFEGAIVRTLMIKGEPWFVGKDVADRLGYIDVTNAMKQHCKGVVKRHPLQTIGGVQEVRILSEPDVLRLIIHSRLPAAERFERWIFEVVLPEIRRTGRFAGRAGGHIGARRTQVGNGREAEVHAFLSERCEAGSNDSVQARKLYLAYQAWSITMARQPMHESRFGRLMNLTEFEKNRGRVIHYLGLRLKLKL